MRIDLSRISEALKSDRGRLEDLHTRHDKRCGVATTGTDRIVPLTSDTVPTPIKHSGAAAKPGILGAQRDHAKCRASRLQPLVRFVRMVQWHCFDPRYHSGQHAEL